MVWYHSSFHLILQPWIFSLFTKHALLFLTAFHNISHYFFLRRFTSQLSISIERFLSEWFLPLDSWWFSSWKQNDAGFEVVYLCWRRWGCCRSPRWPSSGEAVWCWKARWWRADFRSTWQTHSHLCTNIHTALCHSWERHGLENKNTYPEAGLYRLHRPDVHFGSVLPAGEQLGGRVGRTSTLGVEELQRQWFSLQSVTQAKVCVKDKHPNNGAHVQMRRIAKTGRAALDLSPLSAVTLSVTCRRTNQRR